MDDPTEEYRKRKMMAEMLGAQAMSPLKSSDAAPMSPLQPLGQIAQGAAANMLKTRMAGAPQPGGDMASAQSLMQGFGAPPESMAATPGPDPGLLQQLLARFKGQ